MTTSAQLSGTGNDSARPSRNSTLPGLASRALFLAISSIAGVISTPITCPSGPTIFAAIRLSMPAPLPISTTRSPSWSCPCQRKTRSSLREDLPTSHRGSQACWRVDGPCGSDSLDQGLVPQLRILLGSLDASDPDQGSVLSVDCRS